jgi:HD-like signal output (HDOD) protein/ActR/RegA family two-component response regulator
MEQRKHSILFVDDDPFILRGFERSLDEYCENWRADFAFSGKDAINKLSEHSYDAIVTDIHMPVMDGIQLLDAVSRLNPGVIRFVLSGDTSDAQILKSTHLVHQMIPKPCEMQKIYGIVERACCLRDKLSDPQLLRIITGIKTLPSVPRLYNQLREQLQADTISSQAVANIIAQDAAMTAKILQLVNSAFFGLSENINSPQKAVTILGLNTIKSLVLGIQVFSEYQGKKNLPISIDAIWKNSLQVSSLAVSIARSLNLSSREREDARVSGVLLDIGMLLSFQIPGFYQNIIFNKNGQSIIESEYRYMGTSHAEMGGYLLGIWGLPDSIVEAVTFHHSPVVQAALRPDLLTTLHVANGLLNMCQTEKGQNFAAYLDIPYLQKLCLVDRLDEWVLMTHDLLENSHSPDSLES